MSHISASEKRDFIPVRIAVLTVSDTRKIEEDRSGDTLVKRIEAAGHIMLRGISFVMNALILQINCVLGQLTKASTLLFQQVVRD